MLMSVWYKGHFPSLKVFYSMTDWVVLFWLLYIYSTVVISKTMSIYMEHCSKKPPNTGLPSDDWASLSLDVMSHENVKLNHDLIHLASLVCVSKAWWILLCSRVGLNDLKNISDCDYVDWYCNCDTICDIRGDDHFYIIILIVIDFFQGSESNKRCKSKLQ